MPLPWFVQHAARNSYYKAYARIVRGFSSGVAGQDRLGWLEDVTRRSHASVGATCCTQSRFIELVGTSCQADWQGTETPHQCREQQAIRDPHP